jgi:hypothetical protein
MLDMPVDEKAEHDQDEKDLYEQQGVSLALVVIGLRYLIIT